MIYNSRSNSEQNSVYNFAYNIESIWRNTYRKYMCIVYIYIVIKYYRYEVGFIYIILEIKN